MVWSYSNVVDFELCKGGIASDVVVVDVWNQEIFFPQNQITTVSYPTQVCSGSGNYTLCLDPARSSITPYQKFQ